MPTGAEPQPPSCRPEAKPQVPSSRPEAKPQVPSCRPEAKPQVPSSRPEAAGRSGETPVFRPQLHQYSAVRNRTHGFSTQPTFAIINKSQRVPHPFMALWCNWLTRRPLKAKSPGSSPGNATKTLLYINNLTRSARSFSFPFWFWWHFGGTFVIAMSGVIHWWGPRSLER